ncbi:restriction endonuclease [Pseudomonas capsici]|uniref:restriction endonuclease n=1 Tax=Pseudomonas capsici TaxID=2810614 RepID=UPI0021F0D63A|nr:restriction endonuclease [Pseudomonas capsici]MCV4273450.1 restriction endonuclease [Pseudomonas capsici]
MKALLGWALKNAWNLFGVLGVLGTYYFSLMYVPDYVNEARIGKINIIHEGLMNDVQEIAFHEKLLSINQIETLIHGKELSQGVSYPYTTDEFLVQVQERFMSNKFIPLDKRERIFESIDEVRSTYDPVVVGEKKGYDWSIIGSLIISGLGMVVASIGAASLAKKLRVDKETEVDIISEDIVVNERGGSIALAAFEFERMVGDILDEIKVLNKNHGELNAGYDFLAESKDGQFIVEVKKYRKMLGLSSVREFLNKVAVSGRAGILVVSSGATQRALELISDHNKMAGKQKAFLVVGESRESIKKQLVALLRA